MRRFLGFGVLALAPFAVVVVLGAQYAQPTPPGQPAWAYGIPPAAPPGATMPTPPAESKDATLLKVPGSDLTFTQAQISNAFGPADWFPGDHPPMPDIVSKGRMVPGKTANESARACGLCHYPNGKGRAENSSVSGLPVSYFIQQMNDFRNDTRKSSEPRKANAIVMVNIAKAMTEQEIKEAAEYFAAIKWTTPYFRVVETNTVPKTKVAGGVHHLTGAAPGTEPIGQRIIESPEHDARFYLRDPRDGWVAYVPVGSIKKGEALVKTGGNGKTVACAACHGADLLGLGPVPAIAGRSPSMLARQLWDMKQGTRKGMWSDLMKPVVQNLTNEDLVNILAYTVSRPVTSSSTN